MIQKHYSVLPELMLEFQQRFSKSLISSKGKELNVGAIHEKQSETLMNFEQKDHYVMAFKLEDGGILQILFYDETALKKTPLIRSAARR